MSNKNNKKKRKPRKESGFKLGDVIDFDKIIKEKNIKLKPSPEENNS